MTERSKIRSQGKLSQGKDEETLKWITGTQPWEVLEKQVGKDQRGAHVGPVDGGGAHRSSLPAPYVCSSASSPPPAAPLFIELSWQVTIPKHYPSARAGCLCSPLTLLPLF